MFGQWDYVIGVVLLTVASKAVLALSIYFLIFSFTGIKNILFPKKEEKKENKKSPLFIITSNTSEAINWISLQAYKFAPGTRMGIFAGTTTEALDILNCLPTHNINSDEFDQPSANCGNVILKAYQANAEEDLHVGNVDICVLCTNRMSLERVRNIQGLAPSPYLSLNSIIS